MEFESEILPAGNPDSGKKQRALAVPPIDLASKLKGHLYVTRPSLQPYSAARQDLVSLANDLFDVVKAGKVKIDINQRYALKDAMQAHKDLESRKTTGSTVLMP